MKLKMIIVKYIDALVFITFLCCTFILQVELENHFNYMMNVFCGFSFHLSKLMLRWLIYKSQPEITCSKLTTETLEQGVKYVQS